MANGYTWMWKSGGRKEAPSGVSPSQWAVVEARINLLNYSFFLKLVSKYYDTGHVDHRVFGLVAPPLVDDGDGLPNLAREQLGYCVGRPVLTFG